MRDVTSANYFLLLLFLLSLSWNSLALTEEQPQMLAEEEESESLVLYGRSRSENGYYWHKVCGSDLLCSILRWIGEIHEKIASKKMSVRNAKTVSKLKSQEVFQTLLKK